MSRLSAPLLLPPCIHGSIDSNLFPIRQRSQLIHDFFQPLEPSLVLGYRAAVFVVHLDKFAIRFRDIGYFLPQLLDALFDRGLHRKRLPEPQRRGASGSERSSRTVPTPAGKRATLGPFVEGAVPEEPIERIRSLLAHAHGQEKVEPVSQNTQGYAKSAEELERIRSLLAHAQERTAGPFRRLVTRIRESVAPTKHRPRSGNNSGNKDAA